MPVPLDYASPSYERPSREIVIGGIVGAFYGLVLAPLAFIPALALLGSGLVAAFDSIFILGAMQFPVYGAVWGVAAVRGRGMRAFAILLAVYVIVEVLFVTLQHV